MCDYKRCHSVIKNENNQVKYGAIISYALVIGNAFFGLLVTPFILDALGSSDYGVYKSVGSFVSAMMVIDLGIGGTMMRYIAKYRAENKDKKICGFVSMMAAETGVVLIVAAIALCVVYFCLDLIFSAKFTAEEMVLAKELFVLQGILLLLHIISNFVNGIITGHNNFLLGNGTKLLRLLAKIALTYLLLYFFKDALIVVAIDIILTLAIIVVESVYSFKVYKIRLDFRIKQWDLGIFKESFVYTIQIFLTTIAVQVNSNLDNVVVGAFCGSAAVTVYSFGLVIFSMYQQLSTSISGVMLPTVTKLIHTDGGKSKVQDKIVQSGRMQFALLGAAVVGFSIIGMDFLDLWIGSKIGDSTRDVYIITLILMIPSLFELCVNVCLSVLRAKNMLGFRTKILTLCTVLNALVTIIGVNLYGYFAAAAGTALSFVIGSLIVMNIYYSTKLGFPMLKIYGRIFDRTWLCLLVAGVALYISSRFLGGSWLTFFANVGVFSSVYFVCLLFYGFSKQELKRIPVLNKFFQQR